MWWDYSIRMLTTAGLLLTGAASILGATGEISRRMQFTLAGVGFLIVIIGVSLPKSYQITSERRWSEQDEEWRKQRAQWNREDAERMAKGS